LSVVADELAALWDDEVFEKYPSWSEIKAENFISLNAESYFSGEGDIGGRNYAQCVKYGIGREVIAKMLEGTETKSAIEQALASLPLTARRKRGAFGTGRTPNKKPGIAPGLLNFDVAGNPCKAPATNNPHSPSRSMNDEICR
ncbi:MAG: hypothetical protein QG599_3156, partial [Pseudomonadota bacterium]|nr:hypothetical protein [Pseudomonadota bacterium]